MLGYLSRAVIIWGTVCLVAAGCDSLDSVRSNVSDEREALRSACSQPATKAEQELVDALKDRAIAVEYSVDQAGMAVAVTVDITGWGETAFDHLGDFVHVRRLNVCTTVTTASGCAKLGKLRHVEFLALAGPFTDDQMALLLQERLTCVELASGEMSDAGMRQLARLPRLRTLALWRCPNVTDEGFARLAECKELRRLRVGPLPEVTDAALDHIARMGSLETLELSGEMPFSEKALERLKTSNPGLRVILDRP